MLLRSIVFIYLFCYYIIAPRTRARRINNAMITNNGWSGDDWETFMTLRAKANQHQRDEAIRILKIDTERIAKHNIRQAYYKVQK